MTALAIHLSGVALLADPSGALFDAASGSLMVADLHLEKGSAFAARGRPLPPYDTRATLDRLAAVIAHYQPRRVIAVGDSFHDREAGHRLSAEDRQHIAALAEGRDWLWLAGNHDPAQPAGVSGRSGATLPLGPLTLSHGPGGRGPESGRGPENSGPWIAGHLHPKARVATRGGTIAARCFVTDGVNLILPAFGAFTGGLDVHDPAIAGLFPTGFYALVLGPAAVHRIAAGKLRS